MFADSIGTENAFAILKERGRIMAKAGQDNPGGMAAVIGPTAEQVEQVCDTVQSTGAGYVTLANYNSPVQCVIAGELSALDKAEELIGELQVKRTKVIRLKVSAAFHSTMMTRAADEFKAFLSKYTFGTIESGLDLYSNVTGDKITELNAEYLAKHMLSPVRFVEQLKKMQSDGYNIFVECGPGKVLTGLVSKTLINDIHVFNVQDTASLENTITGLNQLGALS
jgi:[acyl-carrier-protein] S-malonyltransferase